MAPMHPGPAPDGLDRALSQVGDRWSLLVVDALLGGARRFGELHAGVAGIATNVLAARLRRLEAAGVVVARPYTHRPLRSSYELTAEGRELADALRLLWRWGGGEGAVPAHDACGSALDVRWWCPTCDRPVDDPGDEPLIHA